MSKIRFFLTAVSKSEPQAPLIPPEGGRRSSTKKAQRIGYGTFPSLETERSRSFGGVRGGLMLVAFMALSLSVEAQYNPIIYYTDTICAGTSYSDAHFTNLTQPGMYLDTLQNGDIVCLFLFHYFVSPVIAYSTSICKGDTYTDDNFTNLTQAGIYYDTLKNANVNGCDSIECLILNYYPQIPVTNYYRTICFGAVYSDVNFSNLTIADTYYDTLHSIINGCDSVICLTLSYYPYLVTQYADTICYGAIYTDSNFQNLTDTGTYLKILQSAVNGCDSIICLILSEYPQIPITNYSASFYIGNPYSDAHFTNLIHAGKYYDTLHSIINGCDSVVCLTLIGLNASISGKIMRQDSTLLDTGLVELYLMSDSGQYVLIDTVILSNDGSYIFTDVLDGDYLVKFIPDSSENTLPTYYGNTEFWDSASIVTIANNLPVDSIDIMVIPLDSLEGNGFISGYVGYGNGQKSLSQKSVSNPAEDVNVYLQRQKSGVWNIVAYTLTNAEGYFEFRNVPAGRYRVILDVPGLTLNNPEIIDINDGDTIRNIEYEITENGINNKTGEVGIVETHCNASLRVYPNPAGNQLTIDCRDVINHVSTVEIYDVVGQCVMTHNTPLNPPSRGEYSPFEGGRGMSEKAPSLLERAGGEVVIDISHLANGMYFLKIGNNVVKFVKE